MSRVESVTIQSEPLAGTPLSVSIQKRAFNGMARGEAWLSACTVATLAQSEFWKCGTLCGGWTGGEVQGTPQVVVTSIIATKKRLQ